MIVLTGFTKEHNDKLKQERLGEEKLNNQGCLMRIVEYNNSSNIIVEFQDMQKLKVKTTYNAYRIGSVFNPNFLYANSKYKQRIGEEYVNNQGYTMKIVKYNGANDIIVEFQDDYKALVHASYSSYKKGEIRNPFHKSIFGVGMIGDKYPAKINGKHTKEYKTWRSMIARAYDTRYSDLHKTYEDVCVCDDWMLFTNFYEWLHSQQNFDRWLNEDQWNLDKDIIKKNNKVYAPEFCCLVPHNVNKLFTNHKTARGQHPVGVTYDKKCGKYRVNCNNPFSKIGNNYLGRYTTAEEAFIVYKKYKEEIIKLVAQDEFNKGNITEKCYNAMINYSIEITD